MSLSGYKVRTLIAVSDLDACGGDTSLHVYASPGNAGKAAATLATIHELDDGRVAWFKDPDGNTFAVEG